MIQIPLPQAESLPTRACYDVIIVGAGAGGGVAAGVLAVAGKSVLLLERGHAISLATTGRDHLRNQRLSRYGINAGPDEVGNPRVMVDMFGNAHTVNPKDGNYSGNAACVGSGTVVYGAQAWRFHPDDFRMASRYGVPGGSSLSDWPITYDDLAPFYQRVEWELGISGDATHMHHLPPYEKPYPMPPVPLTVRGALFQAGADKLGWKTVRVPLLINSVGYNGRPACINCQHCAGFPCPVDAKTGTQNSTIKTALATGNAELVSEAMVERVVTDAGGRATGIAFIARDGVRREVNADVVVLAGGAIETARLLLNSATDREPTGLGNSGDQVGRSLQGHYYAQAIGRFEDEVWDGVGPGVTTATCAFNHDNEAIIGGGMLCDEFITRPIDFWMSRFKPGTKPWGLEAKHWMRHNYRRVTEIMGPVQEIPTPDCRVTLDPEVHDRYGMPVARLCGVAHAETVRTALFMDARAREWLMASGAVEVWGGGHRQYLSGGQHQAGTCRMGNDPRTSVVDATCRVHGHDNLYLADSSVHVTNGGFNPVLTIMSLAWRTAEGIADRW